MAGEVKSGGKTMVTVSAYEALVQAASQIVEPDAIRDLDEGDLSAAAELLQRNRTALESARQALSRRCAVPLRYEESYVSDQCDVLMHVRNLAHAFRAEALLAASDGDYDATAGVGVDILELGNAVRRGGLVMDALFSSAVSEIALNTLRKIRTALDRAARCRLLADLERIESEREPFADIVARDDAWSLAMGYEEKPCDFTALGDAASEEWEISEDERKEMLRIIQQLNNLPVSDRRKMYLDQDNKSLAMLRMLVVDLALRGWRETSPTFPESLVSLTPPLLRALPLDPYTGQSLLYRPLSDTSFLLYSTGPKAFDGGGDFGPWPNVVAGGRFDLCLDVGDYP